MDNTRQIILFAIGLLVLPAAAFASSHCGGKTCLVNPLPNFPTIAKFVEGTLKAVTYVALPIIALFIVYAGFKYVFAQGNVEQIKAAHKNFMYVVIGALLILGAWVLATLIGNTVSDLVRGT